MIVLPTYIDKSQEQSIYKKICRFLYKLGIIGDIMEQDPIKINAIVKKLKEETKDEWSEAVGFYAVVPMKYEGTVASYDLSSAFIQKAFMNSRTGEVRYYWVEKVKKQ